MRNKILTDEQRYKNKLEYIKSYVKRTYVLQVGLKKDRDQDIIDWIDTIPTGNKRDYIRELIRNDMKLKKETN